MQENTIWCERYRPTTMDEFVGNKHIKDKNGTRIIPSVKADLEKTRPT